jgi:alcohol dehydrogenase (cytochrome c)
MQGFVKALRPDGEEAWRYGSERPVVASTLTTAGGLVYVGESTGEFNAFDAESGELLW